MSTRRRNNPLVQTENGAVRGVWSGDVAVFRGVPYAAAPVGELRFMPPRPHPGWKDVHDAGSFGPGCPQLPRSMEANLLGRVEFPQDEDCLFLNVWTPEVEGGRSPVLVWIHGGGFSNGAGSLPWYSGGRLASEGHIVVVTINYRLGPLGFLSLPGAGANLGLQDQIAALKWVRENIAAFGGDPGKITVAGQSAGAVSAITLLASPAAQGLFHRVIAQSPPLGEPPLGRGEAAWITHSYLDVLGVRPSSAHDLRRQPVENLLRAARELERRESRFAEVQRPLRPAIDGDTITESPLAAIEDGAGSRIDMLIGVNHDEMTAFYRSDKHSMSVDREGVLDRYRTEFGDAVGAVYREYAAARPGARPAQVLMDIGADELFRMPVLRLAELRDHNQHPAYVYQFDWESPVEGLGSCHFLELPFVFNNFADWAGAPMLKGKPTVGPSRQIIEPLARAVQQAWIAFVRDGNPNCADMPEWEPYTTTRRITMSIDTAIEGVGDLAGATKRRWWEVRGARTAGGSRAA